jgi:hypothetical protein
MQVGAAQHEVGARLANLGAVEQQPNVRRLGVPATHLQAMGDGLQTNAVTIQAILDALLPVRTH